MTPRHRQHGRPRGAPPEISPAAQVQAGRGLAWAALAAVLAVGVVLGVLRARFGRLIGDEGWYLLAARNVLEGKTPYADFLFTQMPLSPYLYAGPLAGLGFNLLAARWLCLALAAGAVAMVVRACWRMGGYWAALLSAMLLAGNGSFITDMTALRTQPLAVALTAGAFLLIACPRPSLPRVLGAVALLDLAVFVRLSMAPMLLAVGVYLLIVRRDRWKTLAAAAGANVLLLASGAAAFWADGNLFFGVYRFHHEYFADMPTARGVVLWQWALDAAAAQLPLLAGLAASAVIFLVTRKREAWREAWSWPGGLVLTAVVAWVLTTLAHASARKPYAQYQTSNIVPLAIAAAVPLGLWMQRIGSRRLVAAFAALLCVAAGPLQGYRIEWNGNGGLAKVEEAARAIQSLAPRGGRILTWRPELALAADMTLLEGHELAEFSYWPDMESARAARLRISNARLLEADIRARRADVICLSRVDLAVLFASGEGVVRDALFENYKVRREIREYGQFAGTAGGVMVLMTPLGPGERNAPPTGGPATRRAGP